LTKDDKCKPKPGAQVWKIFGQPAPGFVNQIMARPMEGIVWFMSLVATAGLLGMGAPFWFDIFRTVGALIGPKAISRVKVDANDTDLAKAAAQPVGRGMEKPNLEELTDAFYVAAGVTMMPRSGTGAIGMRLGPSSAEVTGLSPKPAAAARTGAAIASSSSPANVSGLPPMRRLPSGWTKKRKKGAS
jgi:hypothetical protein